MSTVLATGGFDPLHSGHIKYLEKASKLGESLVVGVNSDEWLTNKKGKPFLPFEERLSVIKNLKFVSKAFGFDDSDGSACNAIERCLISHTNPIVFVNGGDRTIENSPEWNRYKDDERVVFAFSVGSSIKKNSSSKILQQWNNEIEVVNRKWGYYRVLDDKKYCRVKELVINPGGVITMQRHFHRSEFWFVKEGEIHLIRAGKGYQPSLRNDHHLKQNQRVNIETRDWHQAFNPSSHRNSRIIEIQYGDNCIESDIQRA